MSPTFAIFCWGDVPRLLSFFLAWWSQWAQHAPWPIFGHKTWKILSLGRDELRSASTQTWSFDQSLIPNESNWMLQDYVCKKVFSTPRRSKEMSISHPPMGNESRGMNAMSVVSSGSGRWNVPTKRRNSLSSSSVPTSLTRSGHNKKGRFTGGNMDGRGVTAKKSEHW